MFLISTAAQQKEEAQQKEAKKEAKKQADAA